MSDNTYCVLVSAEEQYSLWDQRDAVPLGWTVVPETASTTKDACSEWVQKNWTDMRPKSLRDAMAKTAAAAPPAQSKSEATPAVVRKPVQLRPPQCASMGPIAKTPWLQEFEPRSGARLRLFCFPYLGGQAEYVRGFPKALPSWIEVVGVQLPGHGRRMGTDAPLDDLKVFVDQCAKALLPAIQASPRYAFMGYSMGTFLAFELSCHLKQNYGTSPDAIIMCAQNPKYVICTDPVLHKMSDDGIVAQLRSVGGLPPALLESEELLRMMLPVYRADSKLSEQEVEDALRWKAELDAGRIPTLDCPIHAYAGRLEKEINKESLEAWKAVTSDKTGAIRIFDGGHFFIDAVHDELCAMLARDLAVYAMQ